MSQCTSPDPGPSDIIYDDMTRAWRNGDYPLAWNLADALLTYLAGPDSGQPLTGPRDPYYVLRLYAYYAPVPYPISAPVPTGRNEASCMTT